jgi:hypothetical protein
MLQYKTETGEYDSKLVQKQADIEEKRQTHKGMAKAAAVTLKNTYPVDKLFKPASRASEVDHNTDEVTEETGLPSAEAAPELDWKDYESTDEKYRRYRGASPTSGTFQRMEADLISRRAMQQYAAGRAVSFEGCSAVVVRVFVEWKSKVAKGEPVGKFESYVAVKVTSAGQYKGLVYHLPTSRFNRECRDLAGSSSMDLMDDDEEEDEEIQLVRHCGGVDDSDEPEADGEEGACSSDDDENELVKPSAHFSVCCLFAVRIFMCMLIIIIIVYYYYLIATCHMRIT